MLSIEPVLNGTYRGSTRHCCHRGYPGHSDCRALVFCEGRRDFYGFDLMSAVIEVENISKRFFLGERNQRAFFEDVAAKGMRGFRRLLRPKELGEERETGRDFWALRDISFQIFQGQTL